MYEYTSLLNSEVREKYENQIRFLQNHLNQQQSLDDKILLQQINHPKKEHYEIMKSDLMEALAVMKILPVDDLDFFHSLAAVNLVNAFLSQKRKQNALGSKERNLFRSMYYFKTYLSEILCKRISEKNFSARIYIKDNFILVEVFGFQFSFHNAPKNEILRNYEKSSFNKEIVWRQKRLQPIAPLLLYYSRGLRQKRKMPRSHQSQGAST